MLEWSDRAAPCVRSNAPSVLRIWVVLILACISVFASDCKTLGFPKFPGISRRVNGPIGPPPAMSTLTGVLRFSSFHSCNFLGLACKSLSLDVSASARRDAVCR